MNALKHRCKTNPKHSYTNPDSENPKPTIHHKHNKHNKPAQTPAVKTNTHNTHPKTPTRNRWKQLDKKKRKGKRDRWQLIDRRRRPRSATRAGRGATFGGIRDTSKEAEIYKQFTGHPEIIIPMTSYCTALKNVLGSIIHDIVISAHSAVSWRERIFKTWNDRSPKAFYKVKMNLNGNVIITFEESHQLQVKLK